MATNTFTEGDTFVDNTEEIIYLSNVTQIFYGGSVEVFGDLGIAVFGGESIRVDTPSDKSYGLDFDGTTAAAQLRVAAGDGIELIADYGVTIDLATDPGLELTGTSPDKELKAKIKDDSGLTLDSDGISINNGCGLTFDEGALTLNFATSSGLKCESDEISIDRRHGLNFDGNFLDIVTAPIEFDKNPPSLPYARSPSGTSGYGIYFIDGAPNGMLLAPGDWLYIVD